MQSPAETPSEPRSEPLDESQREQIGRIRSALGRVIRGKAEVIELLLVALLASGHVLVEDVPGVGKTTLAKALARVLRVAFARVQFTPDLLPADILGSLVLNPKEGTFSFQRGPVFTNVLLADEINRASPRTQSALLEAMNEGQVTVESRTLELPQPFFVIATQNPVEFQGTYPLPEAQLDRFLVRLSVGYPGEADELAMMRDRRRGDPIAEVEPLADGDELRQWQQKARSVEVRPAVARYLLAIVKATRGHADVQIGISPRGTLALYRAAQARALLAEREYVSPDDVHALAVPALAHRLVLTGQARYGGTSAEATIESILAQLKVPT